MSTEQQYFKYDHIRTKYFNLAYWTVWISEIHEQVVTFQVKVYYIFSMQVLHAKGHIHCNQKPFALVKIPDIIT